MERTPYMNLFHKCMICPVSTKSWFQKLWDGVHTSIAFQKCMDGMTFLGVCYDNPERPEIMRHLPNDIDIQNEDGATATSLGHLPNLSDYQCSNAALVGQ